MDDRDWVSTPVRTLDEVPGSTQELDLGRGIKVRARLRATGHKSSEGDGRTAADIRRELAEQRQEDR